MKTQAPQARVETGKAANKHADSEARPKRGFDNYALLVGLYKDYFSMFLAGVAVYVTIVTGVATYAVSAKQNWPFVIVAVSSALLAVASSVAIRRSSGFERDLEKLADEIGITVRPPFAAGVVGWTTLIGAVFVALVSLYLCSTAFP